MSETPKSEKEVFYDLTEPQRIILISCSSSFFDTEPDQPQLSILVQDIYHASKEDFDNEEITENQVSEAIIDLINQKLLIDVTDQYPDGSDQRVIVAPDMRKFIQDSFGKNDPEVDQL